MTVRIDLTDRHDRHADDVRSYAIGKAEKLVHYFDKVNHIEIILDAEHDQHCVDVHVSADRNLHFVGHASNESVMICIDRVLDKLERQVIRAKERMKDHHRGNTSHKQP
ncbi:MAG: ribosome-associated translation inhibitor RaiA [Planctomycetota bacterium]|nr:MAG: ribosome-associated translation inhibitor RaiA [Planctomycetota bacterium]